MPTDKGAERRYDVVIIGAGPVGLAMACRLAKVGLNIAIVDKVTELDLSQPEMDGREIALAHRSQQYLSEIGAWQRIAVNDIHRLQDATVMSGASPFTLDFTRNDSNDEPLGYLVANHNIRQALYEQAAAYTNIHIITERKLKSAWTGNAVLDDGTTLSTQLLIASDSRFSESRRMFGIGAKMKDYGRVMIVCNVEHAKDHNSTARECFLYGKTCAILPLGDKVSSVVITVNANLAQEMLSLSGEQYAQQAEQFISGRLGKMKLITKRFNYPLVGVYSDRFVSRRFALIGDAAVGMHPVTAQGFNMGLQGVDTLANAVIKASNRGTDIGSMRVLQTYEIRHQLHCRPIYEATNAIVKLYTNDHPAAKLVRSATLLLGNKLSPFKNLVARKLTQLQ